MSLLHACHCHLRLFYQYTATLFYDRLWAQRAYSYSKAVISTKHDSFSKLIYLAAMESHAASVPASILKTRLNLLKSVIADIRLQSPIKAINLCPHCYVILGKTLSHCKHRQDNCFDLHPDKRPTRPTISATQQVKASIEVATSAAIKRTSDLSLRQHRLTPLRLDQQAHFWPRHH